MSNRVVTTITAEIDGTVIARFVNSEDAVFFVNTANDAQLFSVSNPGSTAHAYDRHGSMLCCPTAYTSK